MRFQPAFRPDLYVLASLAVMLPQFAAGQSPKKAEILAVVPPETYEVQINGESFQVKSGQRPTKVASRLKKGTTYTLAIRVAMTQTVELNSVRFDYGMPATAQDDHGEKIRRAVLSHELGFSLTIQDIGHRMDAKQCGELLDVLVDSAEKRYTDQKATGIEKRGPIENKFGQSSGKGMKITYKDVAGVACSAMIFVLSGDKYTVGVEVEYSDQEAEDMMPWFRAVLASIRPLH